MIEHVFGNLLLGRTENVDGEVWTIRLALITKVLVRTNHAHYLPVNISLSFGQFITLGDFSLGVGHIFTNLPVDVLN